MSDPFDRESIKRLRRIARDAQNTYVGRNWPSMTDMRRDGIGFGLVDDRAHERLIRRYLDTFQPEFMVDLLSRFALAAPAEGLREALEAVAKERARQDAKWGEQNHDATVWLTVLTEEVGELADAILSRRALLAEGYRLGPAVEAMRNEAAQVAAVAVAFIEWVDRGAPVHENAAAETAAVEIAHHETRAALEANHE